MSSLPSGMLRAMKSVSLRLMMLRSPSTIRTGTRIVSSRVPVRCGCVSHIRSIRCAIAAKSRDVGELA